MKQRYSHLDNMKYEVMDATDLKYQDNYFDVVIEKATIDTLLCGINPSYSVSLMISEMERVLKPTGSLLVVSHGKPEYRTCFFEPPIANLSIKTFVLQPCTSKDEEEKEENSYYLYLGWRKSKSDTP